MKTLGNDLSSKIHALTHSAKGATPPHALLPAQTPMPPVLAGVARRPAVFPAAIPIPFRPQPITARPTVLAIGVSTGGPAALDKILPLLPADFPLPVLIVQHMPDLFTRMFAERLDGRCKLRVREAAEGDAVLAGVISIARGNWHLEVTAPARQGFPATLHLSQGALENHCRPAVDVLFRSVTGIYGTGVLAVVLTGMGSDGMLGCRMIREHGGSVLAQDQASSTVWGMPGAVSNAGLAHKVLPLVDMVPEILRLVSRTHSEARELRESAV
jgi:two-component system chemotaxis response regulator CheB